ncbi:MAG: NUDIX domain-containing protein [Bacteroidota bacterium]
MSKRIDKVAWIYLKDGQILSTLSKGKSKYYIPGGKREVGESDIQTLSREIAEELSVEIVASTVVFWGEYMAQADSHPQGIEVAMQCYFADYQGDLKAAAEIDHFAWLSYKDYERISPVDQLIFDALKAEGRLING